MNNNMRKCPYCGSKVSYIKSLMEIGSSEHLCPECNKYSNIEYSKKIYLPAVVILVLAIALASIFFFSDLKTHLILSFICIIIPFEVFYLLIPLFYMLKIIPSEAKTPVIKVEPDKKSKTKDRKVTETKNIKEHDKSAAAKEKISVSSTKEDNSFKSKFQKFVHTYIVVDDDDDENKRSDTQTVKSNTEILHETEPVIENIEADDDEDINIDLDIEYEDISSSTGVAKSEQIEEFEPIEDIKTDVVSVETETKPEQKKEEIKPEETFKNTDDKPVFHKLTKSKDIDYHYLPDHGESIVVEISFEEEAEPENEDDKEDEEVLNFFEAAPTEQEELEFGKKKYEEPNDVEENEDSEVITEETEEQNIKAETQLSEEYEKEDDSDLQEKDYYFNYLPDPENNIIINFEDENKNVDTSEPHAFAEDEIEDLFSEIENDSYKKALEKSFAKKKEPDKNVFSYEDQTESIFSLNNSDNDETFIEDTQLDEDIDLSNVITYGEEFDSIFGIDDIAVYSNDYLASKDNLFTNIRPYNEESDEEINEPLFEEESEDEEINEPLFEEEPEDEEINEPLFEEEPEDEEINEPLFEEEPEDEEINEPLFEEEPEDEEINEPLFEEELEDEEIHEPLFEEEAEYEEINEPLFEEEPEDEEINELLFEEEPENEEFEETLFDDEPIEGAIEYVPEKGTLEKTKKFEPVKEVKKTNNSFKVTYEDESKEVKKAAGNEKPIDLSGYQTKYYTEENTDKKQKEKKSESAKKTPALSKYERKFPKAAKAAADIEKKQVKSNTLEKSEDKAVKPADTSKKQDKPAKNKKKKKSKGFFATLKQKLADATLEERNQLFEEEEKAEKLAEKEARRKAKELAKEKAKEQEQKQAKKQDNAKKVQKSDDAVSAKEYAVQENIVLESVREKAESMTEKKLSQKEKAQIISKKNIEEKQKREIEKRRMELEKSRAEYEKKSLENKKHREQSEKAEQVRQNQMKKAQQSQAQIKKNTDKRDRSDMKLKGGKNVRSVVSQNNAKINEHIKNNFTDDE